MVSSCEGVADDTKPATVCYVTPGVLSWRCQSFGFSSAEQKLLQQVSAVS